MGKVKNYFHDQICSKADIDRENGIPDEPPPRKSDWDGRSPEELVKENICPRCLGDLDTGWECNFCGYDAIAIAAKQGTVREGF